MTVNNLCTCSKAFSDPALLHYQGKNSHFVLKQFALTGGFAAMAEGPNFDLHFAKVICHYKKHGIKC